MQVPSSEIFGSVSKEVRSRVAPNPFEAYKTGEKLSEMAQLSAAEKRMGTGEAKKLWSVAIEQLDAEHGAAAAADVARESVEKSAKKILSGKQAEKKIDKLTTAIAKGGRVPLTVEDRQLVASVVSPEQKMNLAEGILEQSAEEQRQMQLRAESRGTKPNESLAKEANMIKKASELEQRQTEIGLEMVAILKTEPLTIDELKQATAAERRFRRAEDKRGEVYGKIVARFAERYPDRKDSLEKTRVEIDQTLADKRNSIKLEAVMEMSMDQRLERADSLVITSGVDREENKKALLAEVGVVEVVQADGSVKKEVETGSLLDLQIQAEAAVAVLDKAFAKAVEEAENDPRLADKALTIALQRQIAKRSSEVATERMATAQARALANETAQVAREKAQAENEAKKLAMAQEYDKKLKAVNKFLGTALAGVGMALGGTIAVVGAIAAVPGLAVAALGTAGAVGSEVGRRTFFKTIESRFAGRRDERGAEAMDKNVRIAELEAELAKLKGEPSVM